MAKVHAEKYKTETTWYQKPIEADPDADQDSITTLDVPAHDKDFIFEDDSTKNEENVIFIDVQGQGTLLLNTSQCSKIRKKCNFKSAKKTFLQQNKFETTKNPVFFSPKIAFLVSLNFFLVQKLIFCHF